MSKKCTVEKGSPGGKKGWIGSTRTAFPVGCSYNRAVVAKTPLKKKLIKIHFVFYFLIKYLPWNFFVCS